MAQQGPDLPNVQVIFGLPSPQHRVLRIKHFLTHYRIPFPESVTRPELLEHLVVIQDYFSDKEIVLIASWFRGAGLLSDLRPTLRKAQALTRSIPIAVGAAAAAPATPLPNSRVAYIVPLSGEQECSVCLVTLRGYAFPRTRVTLKCSHDSFTCLECLKQSLDAQIPEKPWDHVACPECPARVSFQQVKAFASPRLFTRYDEKRALSLMQAMPNFIMCSGPNCHSGQIHSSGAKKPIMKCNACGFRTCFKHQAPWHTGLTCDDYTRFHRPKEEQERSSALYLERNSKICPNSKCGLHVQKIDGCDHIYCTHCKHEFCWACLAAYDAIRRVGNTAHTKTCKYHPTILHAPQIQHPQRNTVAVRV